MRSIGGALDLTALARLHFTSLSPEHQAEAIQRQAGIGHGVHTIAQATGLSVEQVRRILGAVGVHGDS